MVRTRRQHRLLRLAAAFVVAFAMVAALTAVASAVAPAPALAASGAAAPVAIGGTCASVELVPVTAADGTTRCVENTCEAIFGAEGRADACTTEQDAAPLDVSVPAAGSGASGVAPAAAEPKPAPTAQASAASSSNVTRLLVWALVGVGVMAALVAAIIAIRGRSRTEARDQADARAHT